MSIQQELADGHKDAIDATVGEAIDRKLEEQTGRHLDDLKKAQEDMAQMLKEKEEQKKVLEEERSKLQETVEKTMKDSEVLEARMKEMEQKAKEERELAEAEHKRQLADLSRRLQDATDSSVADQARWEREAKDRERVGVELADLSRRLQGVTDASTADRARLEQESKERERVEAEHKRQLADLNSRLQETANASAADRTRLEQEVKERERVEAELADLTHRLHDATNASATNQARSEQQVKEREQVEAEHKRQLADLNDRLQGAIDASAADRARLEQEVKERERVEAEHKRLADSTRGLQDEASASATKWEQHQVELKEKDVLMKLTLEELKRELQGQMEEIRKDSGGLEARTKGAEQGVKERQEAEVGLTDLCRRLQDGSAADRAMLEQEVKERERVEAEHKRLADSTRRLQDEANASAAVQAKLEHHQAELKEKDEMIMRTLEERVGGLQRQMEKIKKDSEGLEVRMNGAEQGAKERGLSEVKEREQAEADHKRQLAVLVRHFQDETNASAAHRATLEQEMKKLQDRVATMPPRVPPRVPRSTPYVQFLFTRPLTMTNYFSQPSWPAGRGWRGRASINRQDCVRI